MTNRVVIFLQELFIVAIVAAHTERVRAGRPGVSKGGNRGKGQTSFFSPLSGRKKQTLYRNVFFLSYANETMY